MTVDLFCDAVALSEDMADGSLSAVDLMRATLDRIEVVNPQINAIVSLRDREVLMGEARLADQMSRKGWLHGMPIAVKDLVAVKGVRSTWGSPLLADFVPEADDGLVTRLRDAGAIIIGKSNVPEWGLGSHSYNPVFGVTRNPYDQSRSAGGSTGGGAAALAAGLMPVADGSDMMGSLRSPAAWNNVYGMRPTAGLVPGEPGDSVFQHRLSTRGPIGRSIADVSALLGTLSGGAFTPSGAVPKQPRIGWLGDWGGAVPMEVGVIDLAEDALRVMEGLGWVVEPVARPANLDRLMESWTSLRSFSVAMELGGYWRDPETRAQLKPEAAWEVEEGLKLTVDQVERAAAIRLEWLATFDALAAQFDALVLPATQAWPFPVEWAWPKDIAGVRMETYHGWMAAMVPASLAGAPVLAMPAGFGPDGLPGGVQLIGPRGGDAGILALGEVYHQETRWPERRRPPF